MAHYMCIGSCASGGVMLEWLPEMPIVCNAARLHSQDLTPDSNMTFNGHDAPTFQPLIDSAKCFWRPEDKVLPIPQSTCYLIVRSVCESKPTLHQNQGGRTMHKWSSGANCRPRLSAALARCNKLHAASSLRL